MSVAEPGMLYVVGTPIGNLGDITLRSAETLRGVDEVLAEDTRRSRQLLSHLKIQGIPLSRVDANASARTLEQVVARLQQGRCVALLTDAGMPSVSDPGAALVRACHEAAVGVTVLPGPSAVTTAVAVSGLVDGPFFFYGFLPRKGEKRRRGLGRIAECPDAVVLFEAPSRMESTLRDLAELMPQRSCCAARELTKAFEEVEVRTLQEWCQGEQPPAARSWRGELSLVLGAQELPDAPGPSSERVDEWLAEALGRGLGARQVATELQDRTGLGKRELYQRVLALKARQAGEKGE